MEKIKITVKNGKARPVNPHEEYQRNVVGDSTWKKTKEWKEFESTVQWLPCPEATEDGEYEAVLIEQHKRWNDTEWVSNSENTRVVHIGLENRQIWRIVTQPQEIEFCDICDFPIKPKFDGDKHICSCKATRNTPVPQEKQTNTMHCEYCNMDVETNDEFCPVCNNLVYDEKEEKKTMEKKMTGAMCKTCNSQGLRNCASPEECGNWEPIYEDAKTDKFKIQGYAKGINGKEYPMVEIRKQNGLKRSIVELILNLASPDDDCMLTDFLMALQYVLDSVAQKEERQTMEDRFEIENSGRQTFKFETEAHIKDIQNPDCTIIVQSGYTTIKETDEYAELILNILNEATRK